MHDIIFASMISETAILCYLTWVPNTTAFVRISRARIQQMESLQKNKKVKVITNRIAIIATIISHIIKSFDKILMIPSDLQCRFEGEQSSD